MAAQSPAKRPPNVIWIFGDQHRSQALGCHGDPNLSTPNIDNLATTGTDFVNAVSGFPLCCPYRGALLTSRYPHHAVPGHEHRLPEGMPTVAQPFNEAGYDTAWFGKWHVDGFHESEGRAAFHTVPRERRGGFATWIGYENNNDQYDCYVHGHRGGQYAHASDEQTVEHYRLPGFETDELTDLMLDYLETAGRLQEGGQMRPFFATLSVQPPHDPYIAPPEFRDRHTPARIELRPNVPAHPHYQDEARRKLAGYYAMIENLDWNLGRIRAALREHDLDRSTYIVFFSDHGDSMGCNGQFAKMNPYEESIRVPCIVGRADNYDGFAGRIDTPINHVDMAPTTLGLCGITPPNWMAGSDFSSHIFRGPRATDTRTDGRSAYLQCVKPTYHRNSLDRPWRGVVTADGWKYVVLEGQPLMMFDLNTDPYEQANLAYNMHHAQKRTELQTLLKQWIDRTEDQFDLPEIGR